jgi:hypothetical protein
MNRILTVYQKTCLYPLPGRTHSTYPLNMGLAVSQRRIGLLGDTRNLFLMPGLEICPVRTSSLHRLSYLGSFKCGDFSTGSLFWRTFYGVPIMVSLSP